MPAVHETACSSRRKRLHLALAVMAASIAAAACNDDTAVQTSQDPQHQQSVAQQPVLATTFNAVPSQSAPATGAALQAPQSPAAQAQAASPNGASAADSVVLAPPVIHTVD